MSDPNDIESEETGEEAQHGTCDDCGDDRTASDPPGRCTYCSELEACDGCGGEFSSDNMNDGLCECCEDEALDDFDEDDNELDDEEEDE